MHEALRTLHVTRVAQQCLHSAQCMRSVRKWLSRKNCQLTTLRVWIPWRYHVWGAVHEAFLECFIRSQTQSVKWKSHCRRCGTFIQVQLTTVPIRDWKSRLRQGWLRTFWAFTTCITQKVLTFTAFALFSMLLVQAVFDNAKTARWPWQKAA